MANKTIVITGASAGIGAGIAARLAADGHALVLAARRRPELDRVAEDAMQRGSPRAIEAFGGFDVWINNAGRGITRSVLDLSDRDIDDMISLNVKSALYGMQVAVAHFIERGHGHVINISSFLGRVPLAPHRSAYNGAKAALTALTANLRLDLRARYPGIHVSLIMPGMVATEFGRNAIGSPPNTPPYSGPHVQSVEAVADVVARTIDNPVAEVYTNPASADMARRYFADVEAFETQGDNPWRSRPAEPRP
jgi:short-subunit dehydrogenase